jgi:hypothetical protein
MALSTPHPAQRPKRFLPASDGAPWQTHVLPPARIAPVSPVSKAPKVRTAGDRWRWYKPVTAVLAGVVIGAIAFTAARTVQADESEESLQPLSNTAELRAAGDRALKLISYPWHDLGYEIVFAPGQRDVRAQTDLVAHRITVFLNRGDAAHRVAHDIGHELGHAYDQRYLNFTDRLQYLEARGHANGQWFPGRKFSDYDTGAGDFAEVFASCHAASPEFRSRLATKPSQPCSLIPPIPTQ